MKTNGIFKTDLQRNFKQLKDSRAKSVAEQFYNTLKAFKLHIQLIIMESNTFVPLMEQVCFLVFYCFK